MIQIYTIQSDTCDATFSTSAIDVTDCDRFSVEIKSSGGTTHAGTLTMDVGNESGKWETALTLSTFSAGSALDQFHDNIITAARYVRFTFTRTAGASGETITFTVCGRD